MIFEIKIGRIQKVNRKIRTKNWIRNEVRIPETGYYNPPTLQKLRPRNFVKGQIEHKEDKGWNKGFIKPKQGKDRKNQRKGLGIKGKIVKK